MSELKIIVCLKQIPDPEGPASAFEVSSEAKVVTPVGIPPVINPFDENALEAALQLKDWHGARIIVISLGEKLARPVLSKALAAGADKLILLENELFKEIDSYSTAYVLARAIRKIGEYDLVLTGRQAGDWDFGQTGLILAEILGIPSINLAQKVRVEARSVIVEKLKRNGYEIVRASMPALVTVSSEIGELRSAKLAAIKAARKKPVTLFSLEELQVDQQKLEFRQIFKLSTPHTSRECIFIEAESSQKKGEKLAMKLKEDGMI